MQSIAFPDNSQNPPPVWTVDAITREIKSLIEPLFVGVWVEGEIVTLRPASSGHIYFSLRGSNASLSCALFKGNARRLTTALREGDQVACFGSLEIYPPSGRYQLIVRHVKKSGEGELLAQLEERKKRLRSEGLFDDVRKKRLPFFPRRVGVVTSPTGAAIRDIIRSIHDRFPVPILVAPSAVQGNHAPANLVKALKQLIDIQDVDVIIIARGGGSIEDLWAFNDESLARCIASCDKPVVSAVGHEIDFMLTDFVADVRATTPTHAGVLVVPNRVELETQLQQQQRRARIALKGRVQHARSRLNTIQFRLTDPTRLIRDQWQCLDGLEQRLKRSIIIHSQRSKQRLMSAEQQLRILDPKNRLRREKETLSNAQARLVRAWNNTIERLQSRLVTAEAKLTALGPLSAMERGYAIVRRAEDKRVLREAGDVQCDDRIEVLLRNGTIEATVDAVQLGEKVS